ncbi:WbqC family protein [Mangrovimonas xylaniphaga]|uniref:WbqC family protein n=1 Tax=Mangrovimonas xylaniphaga TaxID=1645915 RepID=UPI0006B5C274|nr:WbqC family protein [Mangrovimonas xylaniphaga]
MDIVIHPTYFPNVAHFAALLQAKTITLEMCDNYQKQTYRNRAYIYAANGKLLLNIPIKHTQKNRQLYKDVKIANDTDWQLLHWKSLESAYRTSPYFEFYEVDLEPLFKTPFEYLLDFNLKCFETICECLQLDINFETTSEYHKDPTPLEDFRSLVNSKGEPQRDFEAYTQVFGDKHGFISNLSILDLLFCEGPNAITYLEAQKLQK